VFALVTAMIEGQPDRNAVTMNAGLNTPISALNPCRA